MTMEVEHHQYIFEHFRDNNFPKTNAAGFLRIYFHVQTATTVAFMPHK